MLGMSDMLRDLFGHQAWADAVHWHALEKLPPALEDDAMRERLHHIYLVQRSFLAIARGEAPGLTKLSDFPTMAALRDDVRRYHDEARVLLPAISPARLADTVLIPWFKDPPCRITVCEALQQSVMHSQYHRGQNATRLRELGGKPPVTDFIVWLWKGRPEPRWS